MGTYLNPGNEGFRQIRNGTYVDKTGLIDFVNKTIDTPDKLTCFTRSRRFGKSFAAKMLCAYYDKSCDSRSLFEGLEISKKDSFDKYLNKFDVIYLDITWFISTCSDINNVVKDIQRKVIKELREAFEDYVDEEETFLPDALAYVSDKTDRMFIFIIDEWDALFRETNDVSLQKEYMYLLRALFKGGVTTDKSIAGAYMTGILPIKKYGTESAMTDFNEYTMTAPDNLAEYVGFTEPEVKELCSKFGIDFEQIRARYDGYSFRCVKHVYNPYSVMNAVEEEEIHNYWTQTESFESLKGYVEMNFDGLMDDIVSMIRGERVSVRISTFQNDMVSLRSKDNVLTLLVHLGYLAYDADSYEVFIPNAEIAEEFEDAVKFSNTK